MIMSLLISKDEQNFQNTLMIRSEIEFIGTINKNGRLVESAGVNNFLKMPKDRQEMFFMKIALRSSMQKDFDEYLGSVNYCMTQRGNSKFISVPRFDGTTILLVTKKEVDHEGIIANIEKIANEEKGDEPI